MKLILVLPAAGLLFSGAMSLDKMSRSPLVLPENPAVESAPKMWANCPVLYKGETFNLYFSLPHPQFLGVIDPDGHFFYVVFPDENSTGKLKPLVTSEQFATVNLLTINSSTFKADPYTWGVLENKPVFTKPGTYRFLLGDNLHTDDEDFLTIVKINYRHALRPAQAAVVFAGE